VALIHSMRLSLTKGAHAAPCGSKKLIWTRPAERIVLTQTLKPSKPCPSFREFFYREIRLLGNARISVVTKILKQPVDHDWLPTIATISTCKQTLLGQENFSDEGYIPPEYLVSFSYLVNGRVFEGSYRANSLQECGHTFEILYDPKNPSRNTGSDVLNDRWIKWGGTIIGIGVALLAIWFWGDQEWFHS